MADDQHQQSRIIEDIICGFGLFTFKSVSHRLNAPVSGLQLMRPSVSTAVALRWEAPVCQSERYDRAIKACLAGRFRCPPLWRNVSQVI
ncbi:hypothetical protein MHYP_G00279550 [Metynnis hypsauchen]